MFTGFSQAASSVDPVWKKLPGKTVIQLPEQLGQPQVFPTDQGPLVVTQASYYWLAWRWDAEAKNLTPVFTGLTYAQRDSKFIASGKILDPDRRDLITVNEAGEISIYNASTWKLLKKFKFSEKLRLDRIQVADVDADGLDEIVAVFESGLAVYTGNGLRKGGVRSGNYYYGFIAQFDSDAGLEALSLEGKLYSLTTFSGKRSYPALNYANYSHVVDVDGDGIEEYITQGSKSWLAYHYNGATAEPTPISFTARPEQTVDVNGDGHNDLILRGDNELFYQLSPLTGPAVPIGPMAGSIASTSAWDIDGDSAPEIFVSHDSRLRIFSQDSTTPLFEQAVSEGGLQDPAFTDLDGDGKREIITCLKSFRGDQLQVLDAADGTLLSLLPITNGEDGKLLFTSFIVVPGIQPRILVSGRIEGTSTNAIFGFSFKRDTGLHYEETLSLSYEMTGTFLGAGEFAPAAGPEVVLGSGYSPHKVIIFNATTSQKLAEVVVPDEPNEPFLSDLDGDGFLDLLYSYYNAGSGLNWIRGGSSIEKAALSSPRAARGIARLSGNQYLLSVGSDSLSAAQWNGTSFTISSTIDMSGTSGTLSKLAAANGLFGGIQKDINAADSLGLWKWDRPSPLLLFSQSAPLLASELGSIHWEWNQSPRVIWVNDGKALTRYTVPDRPTVHSAEPSFGKIGTLVSVKGYDLDKITNVRLGSVTLPVKERRVEELILEIPANARSGNITFSDAKGLLEPVFPFTVGDFELTVTPAQSRIGSLQTAKCTLSIKAAPGLAQPAKITVTPQFKTKLNWTLNRSVLAPDASGNLKARRTPFVGYAPEKYGFVVRAEVGPIVREKKVIFYFMPRPVVETLLIEGKYLTIEGSGLGPRCRVYLNGHNVTSKIIDSDTGEVVLRGPLPFIDGINELTIITREGTRLVVRGRIRDQ